jgi:hypothetical protein
MLGKQGTRKDAENVALQDLRGMVKAKLLEVQSARYMGRPTANASDDGDGPCASALLKPVMVVDKRNLRGPWGGQ